MQRTIQRGNVTNPSILHFEYMLRSICALGICVCKPPALKNARRSLGYLAAMIAMLYLLSASLSDIFEQVVLL